MAPRLPVHLSAIACAPRSSTAKTANQPLRLLKPGRGGLLYFYNYQNSLPACQTQPANPAHHTLIDHLAVQGLTKTQGTGVFFALSEQSCFAAHIKAYVKTGDAPDVAQNDGEGEHEGIRHHLSKEEGSQLQQMAKGRLHKLLTGMGHNVVNIGVTKPYYKRSLLLTQPSLSRQGPLEHAGSYVAKAVWECLQLRPENYGVQTGYDGFLMKFGEKPRLLVADDTEVEGWNVREEAAEEGDEVDHIGDWTFKLDVQDE